jgi:hypothetical protein
MPQIDLAPLMSALIGIGTPTNSLGRLPLVYLRGVTHKYRHAAAAANYRQLRALYEYKRQEKYATSFGPFFREYAELTPTKLA